MPARPADRQRWTAPPGSATPGLRRDLRSCTLDGFFFSFMTGAGEAYIPAFALAMGAGAISAGWMSSGPMLVGALLQMASPWGVRRVGSNRRWVVGCAALQALSFVPLIVGAWRGQTSMLTIFASATAYWAFGMATGPPWNTWVETLVPRRIRSRFFARRSRAAQGGILVGLLFAAGLMHYAESRDFVLLAFGVLFATSLLSRAASVRFLARQSEPEPLPAPAMAAEDAPALDRRLLAYLLALQTSVFIAAPFFTPFMLGPLGLDYVEFTVLIAISFVAKALALPVLGSVAGRFGAKRVLQAAGFGIAPLAAAWNLSHEYFYLAGIQLAGGVAWAAHELAVLLLFFETIPRRQRTRALTWFNLWNTVAIAVGTGIGALVLDVFGEGQAGFVVLFAGSSALRLASLLLITRVSGRSGTVWHPSVRTVAVRPNAAEFDRPVLGTLDPPDADEDDDPRLATATHGAGRRR